MAGSESLRAAPSSSAPASISKPTTHPATRAAKSKADDDFSDEGGLDQSAPELMLYKDIPVIVAAAKREQTQQQAAASVSVVTKDDIQLFGYLSLADVLRDQRSFYLHTDGLNWFAGVRGFMRPGEWNARLLVTVDGRPTHDVIYGQTHLDQDFAIPLEAVKQIEIVRGPGSALYGSNAVFGVVNVVTKDGADVNGLRVKLSGGTEASGRAVILYGKKFDNDWDLITGITASTSEGNNDVIYPGIYGADMNFGHIRNSNYEGVESAFLKAKKGEFTLTMDYGSRAKDNVAATYLTSWFNPGTMTEQRADITARIDHIIAPGKSLHAMVYYSKYLYNQTWGYDAAPPTPFYQYTSQATDDWVGQELYYDWQINPKLHLLTGVEGTQSVRLRQHDHDQIDGDIINQGSSFNSWGLFAEMEYKATDKLTIVGGLRMDHVQRIGTRFDPRLGFIYQLDKPDTLKLLYGRAFRSPNIYEQFYSDPGANAPNPNLRPEVADTYEAVWEREWPNQWRTTLDAYLWKMSDAMVEATLPDGSVQTQNGASIWAHGVEAEIGRRWASGASFRAYATFTHAEQSGRQLAQSPSFILGTAVAVPIIGDKTFLSIDPQIVGAMKNDLGQSTHTTYITNVTLTSRDVFRGWTAQVTAYNLFSRKARLPRDGPFNQVQPFLDYPSTRVMFTISKKF